MKKIPVLMAFIFASSLAHATDPQSLYESTGIVLGKKVDKAKVCGAKRKVLKTEMSSLDPQYSMATCTTDGLKNISALLVTHLVGVPAQIEILTSNLVAKSETLAAAMDEIPHAALKQENPAFHTAMVGGLIKIKKEAKEKEIMNDGAFVMHLRSLQGTKNPEITGASFADCSSVFKDKLAALKAGCDLRKN